MKIPTAELAFWILSSFIALCLLALTIVSLMRITTVRLHNDTIEQFVQKIKKDLLQNGSNEK